MAGAKDVDEIPTWIRSAVWALGIGLGIVATGGGAFARFVVANFDQRLDRIEQFDSATRGIVDGLVVHCAENAKHVEQHEQQSAYWKQRIESNSSAIGDLRTDARSRPDPFTGSDGRKLRELIDANERRLDDVEKALTRIVGKR